MSPKAFTSIELLVVLALLAIFGAMSAVTLLAQRAQAQSIQCVSNLRQWSMALHLYVQDNNGYLPRRGQGVQPVLRIDRIEDWFNALPPYLEMLSYQDLYLAGRAPKPGDASVFLCPSARVTGSFTHFISYGMNMYVSRWDQPARAKMAKLPHPSTLAFMADTPGGYASTIPSSAGYSVMARHNGRANVSFLDGHVKTFPGAYLGCGVAEITQPDIRWKTGLDDDTWSPH